jgi:signal peptidase II
MKNEAKTRRLSDLARFLSTAASVFFIDQFLKYQVRQKGGFYFCNKGISFGLPVSSLVFWLILGIFLVTLLGYSFYKYKKEVFLSLPIFGLALIAGGASSNIFDRLVFGCVFDFFPFLGGFSLFFNFADIAIFTGSFFIIFYLIIKNN